ncbi:leucine-rich repeat protein [Flavonifractor sp. HCP28S3_F3]|uniref:leucine-rich repeat protein n=1 Tax=Flavonifractor sp. HCP28S3_F3 TaxID=3438939 RepID=UPI003F8CA04D
MKKKRAAAGFLILCLLLGLLPAPALALEPAEETSGEEIQLQAASIPEEMSGLCGTNLTWTLSTDGVLTISGTGEMFDYSTSKLPEWNQYNSAIKTLVLSDDITHIGSYAFYRMFQSCNDVYIAEVNLPSKLESIGDYAFASTYKIENITIPSGVTSVGTCAFYYACQKTGFVNGDMDTSQELYGTLTLPARWPSMGERAFGSNFFRHGLTVPAGTTQITNRAFYGCRFQGGLSLPDGLKSVGDEAFSDCAFTGSLILPESLTDVGYGVFYGLDVTSVKIPESWTTIPDKTFQYCRDLTSVTIPAGIKEIGEYSFAYCSALSSVSFPAGLEWIGNRAFMECTSLTQVTLPDGLRKLGDGVFLASGLTSQPAWPSGLEEVGDSIYKMCEGLTGTGTLPDGKMGDDASYTFQDSTISKAVIPDGVTRIPNGAFSSCSKLTFVYIPASVTTIDYLAFYRCSKIAQIYYEGSEEDWANITIDAQSNNYLKNANLHCLGFNHPPVEKPVYDSTTVKRTIRIFDPDNKEYPVPTGFTVEVNGETYNTEGKNYITLEIDKENPPDVTISKAGYRTYVLPGDQIGASNIVYLYRSTVTGPIAQAVLLDKSAGSFICYSNLMQETELVDVNSSRWSARTIYLRVDWNGHGEGKAYLCQSTGWQHELQEGYNEDISFRLLLKPKVPIYLKLVAGDGTVTEQPLKFIVQEREPNYIRATFGSQKTESIIRDPGGSTVDVVDNQTLGVDFSKLMNDHLPVSFELKEDGTIKGTIGLKGQISESTSGFGMDTYTALNDAIVSYKPFDNSANSAALDAFLKEAEEKGILSETTTVNVGISGGIQILGTFEGYVDENWNPQVSSANIVLIFSAGVSYSQNYFVAGAPMYFKAALKASLKNTIQAWIDKDGFLAPRDTWRDPDPTFYPKTFTLGITVENGLGNPRILSGGIQGNGNLSVQFDFPYESNHTKWSLTASAAFVGSLLGFDSGKWVFWNSNELVLYQDGQLLPNSNFSTMAVLDLADVEWVQAGRDYLDQPSEFLANDNVSLQTVDDGKITDNLFKSNVYPYTVPQVMTYSDSTGEKTAAVWLEDVSGRTDENRTGLYYSIYSGSSWSKPALLPAGSDTADFTPVLQVVDDQPMALWMKADDVLASGADVDTTASHMDIAYGILGSGAYQTIGIADGMDMLPTLWKDDEEIKIAFVHCPNGPFEGGQEIWVYSEATKEYTKVAQGLSSIDALAADSSGTLYYSVGTEEGQTLYRLTASGAETVGSGGKPVSACGKLWWYDNGVVRSTSGDQVPAVEGSDWFLPLNFGGKEAVLFRGTTEDSSSTTLYLSVRDGGWGQLIPLLEADGYLSDVSAAVSDKNGKLLILANRQIMGEDYDITQADLMYYEVTPGMDVAVTDVIYDGTTLIPGEMLNVKLQLANQGTEPVSLFQVELYDGAALLGTAYAQETLAPGGSALLTVDLPLPEILPDAVTVKVTSLLADDVSMEDNSVPLALRLSDVSVEEIASTDLGNGSVETVVRVVNRGQNTLANIPISLHVGTADGTSAADSQTIQSLAPGDVAVLSFTSDASVLTSGALVYAVAELTEEQRAQENLLSNNTGFAMVQGGVEEADTQFHMYASAEEKGGQVSVVVAAENNSSEVVTASYYIALYDEDGRMVEASVTAPITVEAGEKAVAAELTVPSAQGLTAKVFVLDGESKPVVPAWSGTVETA